MIDKDLAELYGVPTKRLKEQVKRNIRRFPEDFMFELSAEEVKNLRSQFATSSWGGSRYQSFAFTEHGIALLSSVLNSERAIEVNIAIIRAFVSLREMLSAHKELSEILRFPTKYLKFFQYINFDDIIRNIVNEINIILPQKQ